MISIKTSIQKALGIMILSLTILKTILNRINKIFTDLNKLS